MPTKKRAKTTGRKQAKPTRGSRPRARKSQHAGSKADGDAAGGKPSARKTLVAEAILAEAAELFAGRGFQGTGIREIAEAMEMSRPAVYHYFGSKEAMLEEIVEGTTAALEEFLRLVRDDPHMSHHEKLVEMVQGLVVRIASRPAHMRLLATNEGGLPPRISETHAAKRHEALAHVEATIAAGVEAGELRPVNVRVAAFALFGMCNWIAWWYHPEGELSVQEIASDMARVYVDGLARPQERRGASSVERAVGVLREDVDHLESLLSGATRRRRR